jgi:uncharacterized GH25 family protein
MRKHQNLTGKISLLVGVALLGVLPGQALAFRSWLKPSAVQVEGKSPWVTVDAATSEGVFDFDNVPLKLDGLVITGPDGKPVAADGPATGHLRSTFDLQLNQPGTYRLSVVNVAVMASYTQNGEMQRFRGTEEEFAKAVPANAEGLKVSRTYSRVETFVTYGKPNDTALAPVGSGLELIPLSPPSEMVAGEVAKFRLLLDGHPLANTGVGIVPGGARFRNGLKDTIATTDAKGEVSVTWPMAGEYVLTVGYPPRPQAPQGGQGQGGQGQASPGGQAGAGAPPAAAPGGQGPGGGRGGFDMPPKRYSYSATFEVLPN